MKGKIIAVFKSIGIMALTACVSLIVFGIIVKNMRFDDGLMRKINFLGVTYTVGCPTC